MEKMRKTLKRMISWMIMCSVVTVGSTTNFALADESGEGADVIVSENEENTECATQLPTVSPSQEENTVSQVPTSASIRIVFTSDMHGQLSTTNYANGTETKTGGLERAVTKIEEERSGYGRDNTFLFDIGDVLYDYSTDFIYDTDSSAEQPIYQAMSMLDYDAITLGNHEFDYELSYVQQQLYEAGLDEKCVVSNLTYSSSGNHVWKPNMIVERTVNANDGRKIDIKVGIIGETRPLLSKKRVDHTNNIKTEDVVVNTRAQARELKEEGADLIVVLAHSGIGVEEPELNAENAAYALTKIPEVDVVLCGHKHEDFPKAASNYYSLEGIDEETGLSYGKNLICVSNNVKSIGVADLFLEQASDSTISITNRVSRIDRIDSQISKDSRFAYSNFGKWEEKLISNYSNILAEIKQGVTYENYFGTIEDTSVAQLVNNAKMSYALEYINNTKTKYKDLDVIGFSNYEEYGSSDPYAYTDISDFLLSSQLSSLQMYKTGIYIYCMTGEDLKEWLEWTASAYEKVNKSTKVNTSVDVSELKQNVLQTAWENDWSTFFVFDGIEYTIDPTKDARYDIDGNKVSSSNRITKATINGVEIGNDTQYIVVGNAMFAKGTLPTYIAEKKIYASKDRCQNILKAYIERMSLNGTFKKISDNNWRVNFLKDYNYIVKSGMESSAVAANKDWIEKALGEYDGYQYYLADLGKETIEDTTGPNIVSASLNNEVTNKNVKIVVSANDSSGISKLLYEKGYYAADSKAWEYGENFEKSFECQENGVYSILAIDTFGNKSVSYIRVNNINKSVLQAPTVEAFSNRKTKVKGSAEPNSKVYIELENGKVYSSTVNSNGSFSKTIASQKAGKVFYVYVKDDAGRVSARTEVVVTRTGPNKPTVNAIDSNDKKLTGKVCDTYATPVVVLENEIIVSNDTDLESLTGLDFYDEDFKILKTNISINSSGKYTVTLPHVIEGDSILTVYTVDRILRRSLGSSKTVKATVPGKPTLAQEKITNASKKVSVYMDEKCSVYASVNGKVYKHTEREYDKEKMRYLYTIDIDRTNSGVNVKLYGCNDVGQGGSINVTKVAYYANTPTLDKPKMKAKVITGKVKFIGEDGKRSSLSKSGTEVYVTINGSKKTVKLSSDGTFKVKVKKVRPNLRIVYWAENINGPSIKGVYVTK